MACDADGVGIFFNGGMPLMLWETVVMDRAVIGGMQAGEALAGR